MIFITFDTNNKCTMIHHKPFDKIFGLNKTEEELNKEGVFVEALPEYPESIVGKKAVLYINPLQWRMEDRNLNQTEKLQQMVNNGILTTEQMSNILE